MACSIRAGKCSPEFRPVASTLSVSAFGRNRSANGYRRNICKRSCLLRDCGSFEANCPLTRSLSSNVSEPSVIQLNVQWWMAQETAAQFQVQREKSAADRKRNLPESPVDRQLTNLAPLTKVMPRFSRSAANGLKTLR